MTPSRPAIASTDRSAVDDEAVPQPVELPYETLLAGAGAEGRILHRDDIYGSGPPVDAVSEEILEYVADHVGNRVLDIGCGIGPYVERLCRLGKTCVGIDTNAEAVAAGRALGRPLEVASAYELPYEVDSFDSVILVETLEHLPDPEQALAEAARVARSTLVVTVPDMGVLPAMSKRFIVPWHILEGTHVNFFTPEIMRRTLLRHAASCEVTTLGQFFEVDGEPMHMHVAAVAYLGPAKSRWLRLALRLGRRRG